MAYLPVTPWVRDRANAYLAGMAARGFGTTIEQAVRQAEAAQRYLCPHGEPLADGCADCDREHREATA